jgi:hypothetical protein
MSHSGKKLSVVRFDEISPGMRVISRRNTPGVVRQTFAAKQGDDDNWVAIDWENGNVSENYHFQFSEVTAA